MTCSFFFKESGWYILYMTTCNLKWKKKKKKVDSLTSHYLQELKIITINKQPNISNPYWKLKLQLSFSNSITGRHRSACHIYINNCPWYCIRTNSPINSLIYAFLLYINKVTEWKNNNHKPQNIDVYLITPWTHVSYLQKL